MTVERWDDVRLDRLAESVEQDSQNIRSLLNVVNIHQGNFEVMLTEMRRIGEEVKTIADEVKGLQTENRRILDRLFGDRPG
jgi:methyl-accepting chemotaxis protein